MNELLQELRTAQELVGLLKAKRALNDKREADLAAREKKVELQEAALAESIKRHADLDSAEDILAAARTAQEEARKTLIQVETAQAALQTAEATQLERFNQAKHEAQVLIDQANQVRADKRALEEEKRTYKDRILAEIKAKLGA